MADYYPLIARAIAGLDPNAPGESRRALYERARSALIAQLRSVEPPLSESEITRERLSLEEAVRKVESEAAQRAREAARAAAPRGETLRRANPRPADLRSADSRPADAGGQPNPAQRGRPATAQPAVPDDERAKAANPAMAPELAARPPRGPRGDVAPAPPSLAREPVRAKAPALGPLGPSSGPAAGDAAEEAPLSVPGRDRSGVTRRAPDINAPPLTAVRGFRDITADADDLGQAAAEASRAARKSFANVPPATAEYGSPELGVGEHGEEPEHPHPAYDETIEEDADIAAPGSRSRLSTDRDEQPKKRSGSSFPFKGAIALGVVLILVGAGMLWGKTAMSLVGGLFNSTPAVDTPKDASVVAPASRPKISDRVGQPTTATEQIAPVAQRVVLYDEDPSDPKGKQYVGSVVWRTEPVKGSNGQPADIAVRADIDVPDRKFKMTMSFRRNTDASLPASHTAELTFVLPADFAGGGVSNVPGILMKSNEQARGSPLAGLAVKVTDGFFLVGLSNVDSDRSRNIQLLKERSWFDVPLVYSNQRRAIIAVEKGPPGERAFEDAFAAWGG